MVKFTFDQIWLKSMCHRQNENYWEFAVSYLRGSGSSASYSLRLCLLEFERVHPGLLGTSHETEPRVH